MNITIAGPPRKLPIALKNPLIKVLPFSGSKALSRNSVKVVAIPTKFYSKGPNVIVPTFSAKLVRPTTSAFMLEARLSPKAAFF